MAVWINELKLAELKPILRVLKVVGNNYDASIWEKAFINFYKESGSVLINIHGVKYKNGVKPIVPPKRAKVRIIVREYKPPKSLFKFLASDEENKALKKKFKRLSK